MMQKTTVKLIGDDHDMKERSLWALKVKCWNEMKRDKGMNRERKREMDEHKVFC